MKTSGTLVLASLLLAGFVACSKKDSTPPPMDEPVPDEDVTPIRFGEADIPAARRLRRMTAEQFHASLTVATGQVWTRFETFADTMGRPDFNEVTEEGRLVSVAFEKLAGDAARDTCHLAILADQAATVPEERTIMRFSGPDDTDRALEIENLKYLLLRFHGVRVERDDDPRLTIWLSILRAASTSDRPPTRVDRWKTVCIGLVTHTDFFTY